MKNKELKLQKYIEGTGKSLILLSKEIKETNEVRKEDLELLSKIGANLIFESKAYDFRS